MVLHLKSEAKDKEKFSRVLVLGMSLISLLFGAYGDRLLCYWWGNMTLSPLILMIFGHLLEAVSVVLFLALSCLICFIVWFSNFKELDLRHMVSKNESTLEFNLCSVQLHCLYSHLRNHVIIHGIIPLET